MYQITINEKGGPSRQDSFEKAEITIGRVQGNDVILPKGNISKRHSRIVLKDGKFIIVDLKSTNGTYVNGKKITGPQVVKSTDKIYIGDFTLQITPGGAAAAPAEPELPGRSRPAAEEEIDLFGGDAADDSPRGGGAPGLIDDNFDQEFEAPAEPPRPVKPQPILPAKKVSLPKPVEPEPEPALELDDDFGDMGGPELELASDPDPGLELDVERELAPEPDPEPDPPRSPVLPLRGATKGKSVVQRPQPPPARGKGKKDLDDERAETPAPIVPAAPTSMPAPATTMPAPATSMPAPVTTAPAPATSMPAPVSVAPTSLPAAPMPVSVAPPAVSAPVMMAPAVETWSREQAVRRLHRELIDALALRSVPFSLLRNQKSAALVEANHRVERYKQSGRISAEVAAGLAEAAVKATLDLGPLGDMLADEGVVEVVVGHDRQILADREGRLESTGVAIESEAQLMSLIQALGYLGGVEAGPERPLIDVRLVDGSRLVASLPPVAFRGPTLSIRKTTRDNFTLDKLLEYSTISSSMLTFIDSCVRFRKNVLLSVGPGVTATATLNALVAQVPVDDRLVTLENGIEIHLGAHKNVTALEASGRSLTELMRHALMLQAERVVIGSLGGPGTMDVMRAVTGQLEGSMAAISANSPAEAVDRLARELKPTLEQDEARRWVARAFPVVLQEHRFLDNSRRITAISELVFEGDEVRVEDIFRFKPEGVDENLIVVGSFVPTGYAPRFLEELVDRGEAEVDMNIFKE